MHILMLIAAIAAVDLGIKEEIEARDGAEFPKELKGTKGKIILHKSHNEGFPFQFLKNRPELVKYVPLAVISGLCGILAFLLPKKGFKLEKAALTLTLGGALSNLYDRLKRKYVVDYFSVNLQGIKTVIFNLGDICIFAGTLLFLFADLFHSGKEAADARSKAVRLSGTKGKLCLGSKAAAASQTAGGLTVDVKSVFHNFVDRFRKL